MQGVCWDPIGQYIATQSCDRSVAVYSVDTLTKPGQIECKLLSKSSKITKSEPNSDGSPLKQKSVRLYHDETLISFFRRLSFCVDGSLLMCPAGQVKSTVDELMIHSVHVYSRGGLTG